MTLFLQIIQMVLPVLVMIGLGWLCRRKQVFNIGGLAGLKSLIGTVILPVVLFNAFFTAEYNWKVLLVFAVVYCCFGLALAAGFGLKKLARPYDRFMPFLMTSAEGGMLGYALYALIAGQQNISTFAMVDVGQTMFAYTVFLSALKIADGQKSSPKEILKNIFTNNACIGMLLGIVLGALGVGKLVLGSPVGGVASELIRFITAPTAGVILIIVGYELSLKKELLRPVCITVLLRLAVMAVLLTVSSLIIFSLTPFDKNLFMALMLMFSLPAPFIIPLFADVGKDGEYISTTLSVGTLIAVALFAAIASYSMM